MHWQDYPRIMIFGRPGSGKSTFALRLHKATGLPLYHLDCYFFTANWVERDYQEFLDTQKKLVNQEKWIIDGVAIKSLEMRYQRANLCLNFNFSRLLCLFRIFKRYFSKDPAIKDRADKCPETISWKLITYLWQFEQRAAGLIRELHTKYPHITFIEIRNDKELQKLEKQLLSKSFQDT